MARAAEIKMPDGVRVERFDIEKNVIKGWKTVDGQWAVEEMAGALCWTKPTHSGKIIKEV